MYIYIHSGGKCVTFKWIVFQPGQNFHFSLVSHYRRCLFLSASFKQRTHFMEGLRPPQEQA